MSSPPSPAAMRLSRLLRCSSTRRRLARARAYPGSTWTSIWFKNRRRSSGPPFTNPRSSGQKSAALKLPGRSTARRRMPSTSIVLRVRSSSTASVIAISRVVTPVSTSASILEPGPAGPTSSDSRRALVDLGGHLSLAVAHLVGGGREGQRAGLRFDPDDVGAVPGEQRHRAHRLGQLAGRDLDLGRALAGDNLCVVWILAVDKPGGQLRAAGAEEYLITSLGDDHLHLARLALEYPGELRQRPGRHDEARLQLRGRGRSQLAHRESVAVGRG